MTLITNDMKTPWFHASVNPVRDGWYEVRYYGRDRDFRLRYFQAGIWRTAPGGFTIAFGEGTLAPGECWRGLLEKAE